MALTSEQIEQYERDGYVVVRRLVPPFVVADVHIEARRRVSDQPGSVWDAEVFERANPEVNDPHLHRLLWEPGVIQAVEQLFAASCRAYYGMLAFVPSRGGTGLPWHQDNQYTRFTGPALNTFVAISGIDSGGGQLWVAPGSHKLGTLPSIRAGGDYISHHTIDFEPPGAIEIPRLEPGDACIFSRDTLHCSRTNESTRPRFAYAAQYIAEHARLADNGEPDPLAIPVSGLRERMLAVRELADQELRTGSSHAGTD